MLPSDTKQFTFAVHTLWVYGELGPLEILCLKSWLRLGYRVILHSYDRPWVPDGVELFDADRLVPKEQIFRAARNQSLAVFSDVYRVTIMNHFDALWLDADIFLVRPFYFSARNILACEKNDNIQSINNAVMRLEPNHPIVEEILARYRNPLHGLDWRSPFKNWSFFRDSLLSCNLHAKYLRWGALGRLAISSEIKRSGFEGEILPSKYCMVATQGLFFDAVVDPEMYLSEPLIYIHFYKSRIRRDLSIPTLGSIYEHLWQLVGR